MRSILASESYVDKTKQSGFDSANRNLCEGANSEKKKNQRYFSYNR